MDFDYDLFVIGAGSGGVRLARMSASYGARVGIAEEEQIGGTCVLRGCIPKKLLVYASHYPHEVDDAKGFGWTFGAGTLDWPALIAAKDREINRLSDIYINLLRQSGVEMHAGRATLVDAHTVAIGERTIRARHIAIATGSRPSMPARPGIEHAITSREALSLAARPARIAVVGGGYIAVEFAGIFNGFGSHVDLFYRGEKILRGFDDDVRQFLTDEMTKQGVTIHARAVVESIERADDGTLSVRVGDARHGPYDQVLYATGRVPNVDGLGLEQAGVMLDARGAIAVDAYSATSVPSIHASATSRRGRSSRRWRRATARCLPARCSAGRVSRPITNGCRRRCSASPRSRRSVSPRRPRAIFTTATSTSTARRSRHCATRCRAATSAR